MTEEAMKVWREAVYAYGGLSIPGENERAAAAVIAAAMAADKARIVELEGENAKIRQMLVPQWFYQDGYSSEDCYDSPDEVIENLELEPGHHVVSVDCAGPMPSIWCAVHVMTDEEMDAQETDDRVSFTEHASEEAARATLTREADNADG